jgi:hypothetical protein
VSKRTRIWVGLWVTLFAVLAITVAVGTRPAPKPDATPQYFGGWLEDKDACDAVRESLPPGERYFGDTPAGKAVGGSGDKDVLLTDVEKKLLGRHQETLDQGAVGSCVGAAVTRAVECLLAVQAAANGFGPESVPSIAVEPIYGGSRIEIGVNKRGARPFRGDGSVTAWAGQWCRDYGVLRQDVYGSIDLRAYSVQRCREWGRTGVPAELETVAKESPVKSFTFVRSADELASAIEQGYTGAIGSAIGFGEQGPHQRDADGFLRRNGRWGHCMAYLGVIRGRRPGFLVVNSWGNDWVRGPTGGRDIPPGSFFADWSTVDQMCKEGDAIVFADAAGFPVRPLWFVQANRPTQIARGGK